MDITSHSLVATVVLLLSGRGRRQVYLEKQSWIKRIYFWPSYSLNGPIRSRLHKLLGNKRDSLEKVPCFRSVLKALKVQSIQRRWSAFTVWCRVGL